MSYRKPSPRTLLVVDLTTRKVVVTRDEDMNGGADIAKITKPIYEMVKSGKAIMYYAHRPDDVRQPVEINGRFYAKPSKWVPKIKTAPVATDTPKVRKFFNPTGFADSTDHVEYDGKVFTCVSCDGQHHRCPHWNIDAVEEWIRRGEIIERA